MPKTRKTPQQLRIEAIQNAVDRGMRSEGYKTYIEVADIIGVTNITFYRWMSSGFYNARFESVSHLCRLLKFTPKEMCAIVGVKYE